MVEIKNSELNKDSTKMSKECKSKCLLQSKLDEWLAWDKNPTTLAEIRKLHEEKNYDELEKRLLPRLCFGTAGLRGRMSAGYSCMNDLVIIQTGQGLLHHLQTDRRDLLKKNGIVIGYDGRHNSKRWAELTATIFVVAGYKVRLCSDVIPTPLIPYAVRRYGCASGIMITASHNPKDDNGYKVYDSNSAQIISPWDQRIQLAIVGNCTPRDSSWNTDILVNNHLVIDPQSDCIQSYISEIIGRIPILEAQYVKSAKLHFVYTAMHGVGYHVVQKVADELEAILLPVAEQRDPDPDFPTVQFPNPEEGKSSLDLSIQYANETGCNLILANDPDADRFTAAEKDQKTGEWRLFTGNELGALFGWYALQRFLKQVHHAPLNQVYMLSSTVSSMILKTMAETEGFNFIDTLTGFKWIANKVIDLKKQGKEVLFCFEEAIGFMCDTKVLDKDGISALAYFCCLASFVYGVRNTTLRDLLEDIYYKYGNHVTWNSYYFCDDSVKIKAIFEKIRNYNGTEKHPHELVNGKYKIKSVRDLTIGYDSSQPDNRAILPSSKNSQMITFVFENGLYLTLRTSGTEPKIKYYSELCMKPGDKDPSATKTVTEMVSAICDELLEPELNGLVPKSE